MVESLVAERAFAALPPRWQAVLWHTEVEGLKPAEAALQLGLSANSVAALAYRAREGFKKEWLQAHVSERGVPAECQWSTRRMGDYARGSLTPRAKARFDAHLEACARCSAVLAELGGLSGRLAGLLLPVVIGGSAAASLLASRSETAAADAVMPDIPATKPYRSVTVAVASIALAAAGVTGAAWGVISTASAPTTVTAEPPAPQPPAPDGSEEPPGSGGSKTELEPEPPNDGDTETGTPSSEEPRQPTPPRPPPPPKPVPAPPSPAVVVPENALTNDARPVFTGDGLPGSTIEISYTVDGTRVVVATVIVPAGGHWAAVPLKDVPDGEWTFALTQVRAGARSTPASVSMIIDTIALPPIIDALPPGPLVYLPELTGTAEPGATVMLQSATGGTVASGIVAADGSWSIGLPDGVYDGETLTTIQTDPAGNVSGPSAPTAELSFTYPTLFPGDGAIIPSTGGATIVTLQLGGIPGNRVAVFINGMTTGNIHELTAAPITRVTPALPDGTHTVGLRYVDADGRYGPTITHTVTIVP